MERVDGLARRRLGGGGAAALALQPEAEDDARADDRVVGVRRNAGVEAEGGGFEGGAVGLDVFQKLEAEIVKGELSEGDAVAEVFEVEDFVFEPKKLLVAVAEVVGDEVLDLLVLFLSTLSSKVAERSTRAIRASTRFLRLMYLFRSSVGQKLTSCTVWLALPIRSIRPKRWMMRTGFQWMS